MAIKGLSEAIMSTLLANSKKPMSGYTMTKKLSDIWQASHQQVYRDLNGLLKAGYIDFVCKPQDGKPDLKLYSLTERGIAAAVELATSDDFTVTMAPYRHESVARYVSKNRAYFAKALIAIDERIKALLERQLKLNENADENENAIMSIEHEITMLRAEGSFARLALEKMDARALSRAA